MSEHKENTKMVEIDPPNYITIDLDPEWTVARRFIKCGHVQHACCKQHLDRKCPKGCSNLPVGSPIGRGFMAGTSGETTGGLFVL